jgi:hypothetical protein
MGEYNQRETDRENEREREKERERERERELLAFILGNRWEQKVAVQFASQGR